MTNNITFSLETDKLSFDLIITIMLHDACHDFDNGKTDAPFKEFFLSQSAIPKNAVNRLQKIKTTMLPGGVDGGGKQGLHRGGAEEAAGAKEATDDNETKFRDYINILLLNKYSFQSDSNGNTDNTDGTDNSESFANHVTSWFWIYFGLEEKYNKGNDSEIENLLKDIDFILGLIDKISPETLNYVMFTQLYEKYIVAKTEDNKYYIEELLRKFTDDFTKNLELKDFDYYFDQLHEKPKEQLETILDNNDLETTIKEIEQNRPCGKLTTEGLMEVDAMEKLWTEQENLEEIVEIWKQKTQNVPRGEGRWRDATKLVLRTIRKRQSDGNPPSTTQVKEGGGPTLANVMSDFESYLKIIDNPASVMTPMSDGSLPNLAEIDSSFIEDDDGENYKEHADALTASPDVTDNDKGNAIKEALKTILGKPDGVFDLKLFRTHINYYKGLKTQINRIIKIYLKGAYRRDMGAHDYIDHLSGFTILELYELFTIISGWVNQQESSDHPSFPFKDFRKIYGDELIKSYLHALWAMLLDAWLPGKYPRGSQKEKFTLLDQIIPAGSAQVVETPNGWMLNNDSLADLRRQAEHIKDFMAAFKWEGGRDATPKSTKEFYLHINRQIILLEKYNKYCSKIIDFLDGQKIFYGNTKKNLTPEEKLRRSSIFTDILKYYHDDDAFGQEIKDVTEWQRLYTPMNGIRRPGSSLDTNLWEDTRLRGTNFVTFLRSLDRGVRKYINNAIPSICAQELENFQLTPKCFTSVIDPMGTFGDCYPVPDPNIEGDIIINISCDDKNYINMNLSVERSRNITLSGSVYIMMNGVLKLDIDDIFENNFIKSKPLSIANTVKRLKEHDPNHNARQIVRKFLGDFLQGVEAIIKDLLYLSGDKPATVMYFILNSLYNSPNYKNLGGYLAKGDPCLIFLGDTNIINNLVTSRGRMGGGGQLKDKKRVRKYRKHRTNRKKNTERRKTNKRRTFRRKTSKRRTIRIKNTKRRSTRRNK